VAINCNVPQVRLRAFPVARRFSFSMQGRARLCETASLTLSLKPSLLRSLNVAHSLLQTRASRPTSGPTVPSPFSVGKAVAASSWPRAAAPTTRSLTKLLPPLWSLPS
jgi:hypothetical protein